jgi:flagellar basal body-associated protein FliL
MKYAYGLSDKVIAYLTLISGLIISAVAVWYSVAGLVSIFAASALSIIIMGVALETSKLVATVWLKWNWQRAPRLIKIYLISAIVILMMITSMGIFGYLSKAHLDQNIISGDVQARISLVDEKIKIERENIANAQQVIKQMDAAVNGVIATGDQEFTRRDGTIGIRSAAERSLQIRRSQARDRAELTKQIEESQTRIVKLQEEIAPVRAEMRKVEAEVGPIKYIAKLIYGDQTDQNMLEKAVTWVIIIIVIVFDPLAVVLLLASQYSFQWFRQQSKERKDELVQEETPPEGSGEETPTASEPIVGTVDEGSRIEQPETQELPARDDVAEEANRKIAEIEQNVIEPELPEEPKSNEKDPLTEWNEMIAEAERAVTEEEEQKIIDDSPHNIKEAMTKWKSENPNDSLKHQRALKDKGIIDILPWEDYLKAQPDDENIAAVEAAKWAQEQLEKTQEISYIEKEGQTQIRKTGYRQNEEQSDKTLWQKVKDIKNDK